MLTFTQKAQLCIFVPEVHNIYQPDIWKLHFVMLRTLIYKKKKKILPIISLFTLRLFFLLMYRYLPLEARSNRAKKISYHASMHAQILKC